MHVKHKRCIRTATVVFLSSVFLYASDSTVSSIVPTLTARAVLERAEWIFAHAHAVSYNHPKNLSEEQVWYEQNVLHVETDCSGFISNLLYTMARESYDAAARKRTYMFHPNAADYADFFCGTFAEQSRIGLDCSF